MKTGIIADSEAGPSRLRQARPGGTRNFECPGQLLASARSYWQAPESWHWPAPMMLVAQLYGFHLAPVVAHLTIYEKKKLDSPLTRKKLDKLSPRSLHWHISAPHSRLQLRAAATVRARLRNARGTDAHGSIHMGSGSKKAARSIMFLAWCESHALAANVLKSCALSD